MLQAVAEDTMFGPFLSFVTKGTVKHNPVSAVFVTSLLVQVGANTTYEQLKKFRNYIGKLGQFK